MQNRRPFDFIIAAAIGALILTLTGYFIHAAPGDAVSFGYWIGRPIRYDVWLWAALGAAAGSGVYWLGRR